MSAYSTWVFWEVKIRVGLLTVAVFAGAFC